MATEMPAVYQEFQRIGQQLERHYRDVQDLEFTIERGRLYMLQTRSAKRTAAAAVRIAVGHGGGGPHQQGGGGRARRAGTRGPAPARPVRPGGAQGRTPRWPRASTPRRVPPWVAPCSTRMTRSRGSSAARRSCWCASRPAPTTSTAWPWPQGILTARGGATTHAAVVARQIGKPCVAGCAELRIDYKAKTARSTETGVSFAEGDWISVDGSTGEVYVGAVPTVAARFEDQPDLQRVLGWADEIRRMGVWTNADKPEEAERARAYGAQGIGLCRTEHMFREGERLEIVRGAILIAHQATRAKARAAAGRDPVRRGVGCRRALRRRDGPAGGAPAGRLRGHLQGHGRPARGHPAHRPAAPRVPAQPRGAAGQGDQGRRRGDRRGQDAARDHPVDARAEPDAGAPGLPPGAHDPRLRQDPDPGHPERPDRGQEGRGQPHRQDR